MKAFFIPRHRVQKQCIRYNKEIKRSIVNAYLQLESWSHQKTEINGEKKSFFSTQSDASLREQGIFDERNLLKFDTLHELQERATIAFADNPIFGTHTEREGQKAQFEWMKFSEYGEKVNHCRTVLKDLGKKKQMHLSYYVMKQVWRFFSFNN